MGGDFGDGVCVDFWIGFVEQLVNFVECDFCYVFFLIFGDLFECDCFEGVIFFNLGLGGINFLLV